jgi:hypothetical protein
MSTARRAGPGRTLEDELRRTLADPPVAALEVADPLAALDRRVGAARRRRRAAAALSLAALLAAGGSGAGALVRHPAGGGRGVVDTSGAAAQAPPASRAVLPPAEVVAAARTALSGVIGGRPDGPVRWVAIGAGDYLVQIRLTGTATCRFCRDPAAGPDPVRGSVIEVRVYAAPVPAAGGAAPGRASPGPSRAYDSSVAGWALLPRGTDLSRFGPVHEFPFPDR